MISCEWKNKGTNLEILVGEFIDFAFKHLKELINSNIEVWRILGIQQNISRSNNYCRFLKNKTKENKTTLGSRVYLYCGLYNHLECQDSIVGSIEGGNHCKLRSKWYISIFKCDLNLDVIPKRRNWQAVHVTKLKHIPQRKTCYIPKLFNSSQLVEGWLACY